MSTNHKDIGTLYLIFARIAGIIGGVISGLMRLELAAPGLQYLPEWAGSLDGAYHLWTVFLTAHGLILVFFMVMHAMHCRFGHWFIPLTLAQPDICFPPTTHPRLRLPVPPSHLLSPHI